MIIDLDEPSLFAIERRRGRRVSLRLYKPSCRAGLERSLDATEYLGPVQVISSYRDPAQRGAVRIDVEMAEDVPNDSVRQDGSRLYWDFRKSRSSARALAGARLPRDASAAAQDRRLLQRGRWPRWSSRRRWPRPPRRQRLRCAPAPAKKRYTGRRIDLDFKGADIHNILRLLADVGEVNIVTSDDVKGEVTIKMRDVPWDQALDVVLRQKQLGQVREGNLIRVAPLQVLEKELEQEIARQKQITEVLPTETRLIGVSYAEAKQLTDRAKDLLSPRGKISVDERTNTLIVSDVARNLALIEELVRNLDTQTSQVVIEARIVEARSTFVRQIGVQWGGTGFADAAHGNPTGLVFPHNIGVGGGATDGKTPLEGLVRSRSGTGAANPNFAVNLPAAVGTGAGGALGLTLGSVAGAFNLNLRLSAMESTGQVRILSSPRISTLDNTEASIEQGVSIPISVVSAQGVQTVFVDAKLNLTVKPHVTNEGTVMMDIKVTRNEPDFVNTGARGDPTILKKEANDHDAGARRRHRGHRRHLPAQLGPQLRQGAVLRRHPRAGRAVPQPPGERRPHRVPGLHHPSHREPRPCARTMTMHPATSRPVVLIGFMGTGKTTVGRLLAERLGRRFLDLDDVIVRAGRAARSPTSSATRASRPFASSSSEALGRALAQDDVVLATGGGAACREDNLPIMLARGQVVALSAPPEEVLRRTGAPLGPAAARRRRRSAGGGARPAGQREPFYCPRPHPGRHRGQAARGGRRPRCSRRWEREGES